MHSPFLLALFVYNMKESIITLLLLQFCVSNCLTYNPSPLESIKSDQEETFVAAVYEHAVIIAPKRDVIVSRQEALLLMNQNLDILEAKAKLAKGADILIFPEDGIYGMGFKSRDVIAPYMEYIPDPSKTKWCPCNLNDNETSSNRSVQKRLSCIAKHYEYYLVANMGDIVHCDKQDDLTCPTDGRYLFNTNVVFDQNGCLVAKYHKENLFLTEPFDRPPKVEFTFFDTPFGRFGTFTCFDILFYKPAVILVEKYKINHVAFPTAWMDVLPLFAAIETHQAFARMMGVNLLGANIHLPLMRMVGSGIYTPQGPQAYTYKPDTVAGQFVMATIPKKPKPNLPYEPKYSTNMSCPESETPETFSSVLFGDQYTFALLAKPSDRLCVCQKRVCCYLNYKINDSNNATFLSDDETKNINGSVKQLYAFGAFDGLHTLEGQYYIQACALVKCANDSKTSCGSSTKDANVKFGFISLQGDFDTKYIFPEVLGSPIGKDIGKWNYERGGIFINNTQEALLSAMLLGRWYEKDNGYETLTTSAVSPILYTYVFLCIVFANVIFIQLNQN